MSGLIIRPARVEDAVSITGVHVQAWRETYADHFPAEFLASIDGIFSAEIWAKTIAGTESQVIVADVDGRVVGWAVASGHIERELEGIYVIQEFHGTGAGQRLLDSLLGDSAAYLWVIENNPRAEAFYTKNGFIRDGARKATPFAGQTLPLIRMVRSGSRT